MSNNNYPFCGKLTDAIYDTREALYQDLQIKLARWDSHTDMNPTIRNVGKLHAMRDYVELLNEIEKLAHDALNAFNK